MINDIQVAIIGGGTSGLSCAIELAKLGLKSETIVFEREEKTGGAPRHCGHRGFGIAEFKRPLTGDEYADELLKLATKNRVQIKTLHSLYKIKKDNILYFSTPSGIKKYRAKKIIFATGVRESPRSARLISGTRSPNIITTGALQRFLYINKRVPFKSGVIFGSEDVSFSALWSMKRFEISPQAMLESSEDIQTYPILYPIGKYIFKTKIDTNVKNAYIKGEDKQIEAVSYQIEDDKDSTLCEGVIFSGDFKPESSTFRNYLSDFNLLNDSAHISQNFQTEDGSIFVIGNAIRGALSSFSCYYEAKKCANFVYKNLNSTKKPKMIKIEPDEEMQWYYPSMLDIDNPDKILTNIKLKRSGNYKIEILLNGKMMLTKSGYFKSYQKIKIPKLNVDIKEDDTIKIAIS